MIDIANTSEQGQLLTVLDSNISRCSNLLRATFLICDQQIKGIAENRGSDWFYDDAIKELGLLIDQVAHVNDRELQNEIRATLLSFPAYDRHYELLYVLIKEVLTNLGICIKEIEKYLANQEFYDNFIKVRYANNFYDSRDEETKERDTLDVQESLLKLHSNYYSSNLLHRARRLTYIIKSIIPATDLTKVLPDEESTKILIQEQETTELSAKLKWKGDKTDLAEVVYALYKSEVITDTSTGKDVTKKLLAKRLGDLFCIDLTDMETPMKGRKNSNKAFYDGKTFTRQLAQIVDNFMKIT